MHHIFVTHSSAEGHLVSSLFQDRGSTPQMAWTQWQAEMWYKSLGPGTLPGNSEQPVQSRALCGHMWTPPAAH